MTVNTTKTGASLVLGDIIQYWFGPVIIKGLLPYHGRIDAFKDDLVAHVQNYSGKTREIILHKNQDYELVTQEDFNQYAKIRGANAF